VAYRVKEIFHTLQGEGAQSGRAATFVRFTGCNLWSGHEAQRASAICQFCDTDFVGTDGPGGGAFADPLELAERVEAAWVEACGPDAPGRFVVCTGGEPLQQLDEAAVAALHKRGFEVAIETNGTLPVPAGVDWVCVSPKAAADLVLDEADELKLVYPQEGAPPERYEHLAVRHRFLSPMDGPDLAANRLAAAAYCRGHPAWRLTLQAHKVIGIP
jgi:7-carboxy-7-deazaguanine synthase (Cx14CxxC type)